MSLPRLNLFGTPPDARTHDGREGKGTADPHEFLADCKYSTQDAKEKRACEDKLKREFQKYSRDSRYYGCEILRMYHPDEIVAHLVCKRR